MGEAPSHADVEALEIEAWTDMLAAAPPALAGTFGFATTRVGSTTCFSSRGLPSNEFNRAVGLGLAAPATDAEIDAVLAHYRGLGLASAWVQLADAAQPGDLAQRLTARGATATGRAWIMTGRRPAPLPPPPTDLRIAMVEPSQAAAAAAVFRIGYGLPESFDSIVTALSGRPGWTLYAAFDGARPVAFAMTWQRGGLAQLSGAATLPQARGRGAQTALIARRISDLAAQGAAWVQVFTWRPAAGARNPSLDNIERAGFRRLYTRENYVIGPG